MSVVLKPVDSSNVHSMGYDPASRTLAVRFHSGATYHYENVSPEKHEAFANAKSKGGYLAKHIRPAHRAKRVDRP